jgi:hypothetical protein
MGLWDHLLHLWDQQHLWVHQEYLEDRWGQ